MKDAIYSTAIWGAVCAGVVVDKWYGITWAGNISMFLIWFFTCVSVLALFGEEKTQNNKSAGRYIMRLAYVATLAVMVGAGWFITASFSLVAWMLLFAKRMEGPKTEDSAAA